MLRPQTSARSASASASASTTIAKVNPTLSKDATRLCGPDAFVGLGALGRAAFLNFTEGIVALVTGKPRPPAAAAGSVVSTEAPALAPQTRESVEEMAQRVEKLRAMASRADQLADQLTVEMQKQMGDAIAQQSQSEAKAHQRERLELPPPLPSLGDLALLYLVVGGVPACLLLGTRTAIAPTVAYLLPSVAAQANSTLSALVTCTYLAGPLYGARADQADDYNAVVRNAFSLLVLGAALAAVGAAQAIGPGLALSPALSVAVYTLGTVLAGVGASGCTALVFALGGSYSMLRPEVAASNTSLVFLVVGCGAWAGE